MKVFWELNIYEKNVNESNRILKKEFCLEKSKKPFSDDRKNFIRFSKIISYAEFENRAWNLPYSWSKLSIFQKKFKQTWVWTRFICFYGKIYVWYEHLSPFYSIFNKVKKVEMTTLGALPQSQQWMIYNFEMKAIYVKLRINSKNRGQILCY